MSTKSDKIEIEVWEKNWFGVDKEGVLYMFVKDDPFILGRKITLTTVSGWGFVVQEKPVSKSKAIKIIRAYGHRVSFPVDKRPFW